MSSTARLGSSFKGAALDGGGQLGSLQGAGAAGGSNSIFGKPKNWFDEALAEQKESG